MTETTKMTAKGLATIPRAIRERLGLQAGDKMAWTILSNGTVVVRPKTRRLSDLVGVLNDQREQRIQRLRSLVEEGLASGPARPLTEADWAELCGIANGDIE